MFSELTEHSYTLGYIVGSLSAESINRTLGEGADTVGARKSDVRRDSRRRPSAVQP
jgi:hypothetical protein